MTNIKAVKIAIISIYSFPKGLAATNRILAYSKGLIKNGATVDVFMPFPTDKVISSINCKTVGTFQGISYYYTSGRYKSSRKIFRAISVISGYRKINGYIKSVRKIFLQFNNKKYNFLIISNDSIAMLVIYSMLARILKIKSIFIFDEFPIPIRHKLKSKLPQWKILFYKLALKKIDAYISISKQLSDFYNKISQHKTFIMPVIVDVSRFDDQIKPKNIIEPVSKYLCYMGNMEITKDDVDNIIKAFGLISDKYPSLTLRLYGSPSVNTKKYLKKLIATLNLKNCVILMGKVNSLEVPQILQNAHILVSSQPDTVRAKGGFPTKLGEYLLSGTPAVITNVGENAKYVKDNIHLFFVEAGNPKAYADKLEYILNNYEKALEVAKNGKQYVYDNYSHIKQGKKLLNFLKSI